MADSPPPSAISPPRAAISPAPAVISPPAAAISLALAAISPDPAAFSPSRHAALVFEEASRLASTSRNQLLRAAQRDESSRRALTEILLKAAHTEKGAAEAAELESSGQVLTPTTQHPDLPRRAHSAADVATEGSHSSAFVRLLRSAERDESTDPSRRDRRRRSVQDRFDSERRLIIEAILKLDVSLRAPFCSVGVASDDPKQVRMSIQLVEELCSCRKRLLAEAEDAVRSGNYEDAAHCINVVACLGWDLSSAEISLFTVANMTFVSELKYSMLSLKSNDLLFVKEELKEWCCYVIQTLDAYLLPFAEGRDAIKYNQLKGFFWGKIAELDNDSVLFALSFTAYETGYNQAAQLQPADPLRLSITVDLIICFDTRLRCRQRANRIAKEAWESADSAIRTDASVALIDQWETYNWLNWLANKIMEWSNKRELRPLRSCKRRPRSTLQYSHKQIRHGGCGDAPVKRESVTAEDELPQHSVYEVGSDSEPSVKRAARHQADMLGSDQYQK